MAAAMLVLIILSANSNALFDSVFEGGFQWLSEKAGGVFKQALKVSVLALNITPEMNSEKWPLLSNLRSSLGWLSFLFVILLMIQGIRYIASADSPSQMQQAKADIKKLIGGIMLVSFSDTIFFFALDIANALTRAFAGSIETSTNGLELVIFAQATGIMCVLMPLGSFLALGLCLVCLARYLAIFFLWAVFPAVLAFQVSGFSPLQRIGSRCISLFVACLAAGPVMGGLMSISLGLLSQATGQAMQDENLVESIFAIFLAFAGLALSMLSPFLLIAGPLSSGAISAIAPIAGAGTGAALGAMTGSLASTMGGPQAEGTGNSRDRDLLDPVRSAATRAAATSDYRADADGMGRFFERLKKEGVLDVDDQGVFQVGSAGRHLAEGTGLLEGLKERGLPHGRGFGDARSIDDAIESHAVSDDRILMKNATTKTVAKGYEVDVSKGTTGYSVNVEGPESSGFFQVPGSVAQDEQGLIEVIEGIMERTGADPMSVTRDLRKVQDG